MIDFLMISSKLTNKGVYEITPNFRTYPKSKDLMIRGGDFYAIWIEEKHIWSTDEEDALMLIDQELDKYAKEHFRDTDSVSVLYLQNSTNGMIDKWHKFCQKQLRDNFHNLNETLIFSNMEAKKEDYASKHLNYPLEKGDISAWDTLISTLYSQEERDKIEWCIGSIVNGDSRDLQKFAVLYGSAGTGKSTILNVIQKLFEGYFCVFDARSIGSANNQFSLEPFKANPLVGIQHDGDLSRIEDNTKLNSLVSHEAMPVNEKNKSIYTNSFKCFLFIGTNKPVKITDAKSGLLRRLIDISPSGERLKSREYNRIMKEIDFELGAIAWHCKEVYENDIHKYDDYKPLNMLDASNDFYNFVADSYRTFEEENGVSLVRAWEMYKEYCDDANVQYPFSKRIFKQELKNYFNEFKERHTLEDGSRVRNYYLDFDTSKFESKTYSTPKEKEEDPLIEFKEIDSIFDKTCCDYEAQYANDSGTPKSKWENCKTKLKDIDTHELHYVKVPENHIVIDFDIPGEDGEKNFDLNLIEASKWPKTYAELSKSGAGIHLHYIYKGDPAKLSRIYKDHVEIKVFAGNSSLRRKLSKCNDIPIATISSGLPLKGEKKMINFNAVTNEKTIRSGIKKNLNKEVHPGTKPSIDFIFKILEDAYQEGVKYDVTDLMNSVIAFAAGSTHHAQYCMNLVSKMHFKSEEASENCEDKNASLVFYDVEVFPNLFLINWKMRGKDKPVVRMINPTPNEVEDLMQFNLIGFNCRKYDNHMLYARMIGYSNEQLFDLSQKIVEHKGGANPFFGEAYNISYTDVYDFCSKKQSLKKWEIELGIHHKELGLPWDKPVPEEKWEQVAEYCDNDVIATEAVFEARQADFNARKMLVKLVEAVHGIKMSVNDTTNTLSTKLIFGKNKFPQGEFNWRDLSKPVSPDRYDEYRAKFGPDYNFRIWDENGLPLYESYTPGSELPKGYSILPFFKGYKYENRVSTYLNETIGEGGRVYSEPGIYGDVWDGDVSSMHPHSAIFEMIFGPVYTKRFIDIVKARVAIKHKDFSAIENMLDGVLVQFVEDPNIETKDLAQALKIVINSIYGLTSAAFVNPFRDPNNIDNIVAKRGALFMTLLKQEVQKRGFKVCHIKTDSIKIPDATEEIKDFVVKFGREYGYEFETEAIFDKYCLVNDAVYVGKHKGDDEDGKWTATGTQFQVPYVFKTLFTKESIEFDDMCETKQVSKGTIYIDTNEDLPDVTVYETELEKRKKGAKRLNPELENYSDEDLVKAIQEGHNYIFVGRVGRFCPIKPGHGGGVLYREHDGGKYDAVTGTKGYRWLESEVVKGLGKESDIDDKYYRNLVDDALDAIRKFGDAEWFISDAEYNGNSNINSTQQTF